MTTHDLHAALDAIEKADPLADLAARLIRDGWSQEKLVRALRQGERNHSPIGVTLVNKYREVCRDLGREP
jgi:hypothetical protein